MPNPETLESHSRELCALVDWSRPELANHAAHGLWRHGDAVAAATAFVRLMRSREQPHPGYDLAAVERRRACATPTARADAQAAIERSIRDADITRRGVNTIHVSENDIFLGMSRERFRAGAQRVAESRQAWGDWGKTGWGTAHAVANYVRRAWRVAECDDDAFVPVLHWLCVQVAAEWSWSRGWDENLLGSHGHNWWLHTYAGLAIAGTLLPELKPLAPFQGMLPGWFEHELLKLMQPDGFTRERSGYHWGTANMCFELARFIELNHLPLSPVAVDRLRAIDDADWRLIASDGSLPYVGDTAPHRAAGSLVGALRRNAARSNLPVSKWVARQLDPAGEPAPGTPMPDHDRDLGPDYDKLLPHPPDSPDTALPASGYYMLRGAWSPTADSLFIDAGTRGGVVTSHDHAAPLHILLHARGRATLIDNCSGPYGDHPARTWRVGSFAHNVATADGRHLVPFANEWRFTAEIPVTVESFVSEPRFAYFAALHEGYARLEKPIACTRRKIFHLRGDYFIVIDRFTAASTEHPHVYNLDFHLDKALKTRLETDGRAVTQGPDGNLMILPVLGPNRPALLEPCPHPLDHYDNPDHLRYTLETQGHGLLVTLLVPFEGAPPPVNARPIEANAGGAPARSWEVTALEIDFNGRRDVFIEQHMEWSLACDAGGMRTSRRVFHSRCHADSD